MDLHLHLHKHERDIAVLDELANVAQRNIGSSESVLEVLPVDPVKYPDQLAHHFRGNPTEPAIIDSIATLANNKYLILREKLHDSNKKHRKLDMVGEILSAGNNVELVTNHGDFIDIALAQAAAYSELKDLGYNPEETGIIVNRSVSLIGAKLGDNISPATEVLRLLSADTFLSYPRTNFMKQSRLKELFYDDYEKHNARVREAVDNFLKAGGKFLAMAGSGSVDEAVGNEVNMEAISRGTSEIMMYDKKTFVLPVGIWLRGSEPVLEICDIPRVLHTVEETHRIMQKIGEVLTREVAYKTFKYSSVR